MKRSINEEKPVTNNMTKEIVTSSRNDSRASSASSSPKSDYRTKDNNNDTEG